MGRERFSWEYLARNSDLTMELIPGQPIVEIAGNNRVLIEGHMGVLAYGREEIVVKMKYGCACVCGCELQLLCMNRERLVICGRIDTVTLRGRRKP